MAKLRWDQYAPGEGGYNSPTWVGNERYWISYVKNEFISQAFDEGEEVAYKCHRSLKQAKAWCEAKERKRLKTNA